MFFVAASPMIRPREKVVLALGGNALIEPGKDATVQSQLARVRRAMRAILPLVAAENRIVLTHGNGFQVGNILIRVQEALGKAYSLPLEVCVAESQGELGYLIEQTLQNVLTGAGLRRPVVSVLTQILVDPKDPAFRRPTKPIGPFYTRAQARRLVQDGQRVVHQPGRGYRTLVASPDPLEIDDVEVLRWLLRRNAIVIAAGGGGVPVVRGRGGTLRGVPAVIDKDLASATLARAIRARHLVILTGEPCVYRNYRRAGQRPLRRLTIAAAERYAAEGHFPPGSMGPKIEAAIRFLQGGGRSALITSPVHLGRALAGGAGTTLVKQTASRRGTR